jgi:putative transposase
VPGATSPALQADVLALFQQLLPAYFFWEALHQAGVRQNNRVYTAAVVIWMMTAQRLHNGTLQTAVLDLLRGLPASFWPDPCKRLQCSVGQEAPNLSSNTGAYHQARKGLPVSVVNQAYDRAFKLLVALMSGVVPEIGQSTYFIDGTSIRTAYSKELCRLYPPSRNQNGESHWPLIRLLVLHDLVTGLALRPVWGPMHGDHAISEQALLVRTIDQLPDFAVLLADANFGIFSVAYAADQRQHPVLFRMTLARARRLYGGELRDGIDQRVEWKPTRWDRQTNPQLPADAMVSGRLIVRQVQPSNGDKAFLLALFTTLESEAEAVVQLYGKRWNIETDLRTLKSTLQLEQLTCTQPEMVEKEIPIALLAYNLVRAATYQAAQKAGLTPRDFSFTRVRNVINAFLPAIAAASTEAQAQKLLRDMMYYVGQARLPKRQGKRPSYPRAVWPQKKPFPSKHA